MAYAFFSYKKRLPQFKLYYFLLHIEKSFVPVRITDRDLD